jgi:hypothetical protein
MSKIYAAGLLPCAVALTANLFLEAWGMPSQATIVICLGLGFGLFLIGDEVENYYFREIYEGKEALHRAIRFAVFLPALYAAGFLVLLTLLWLSVLPFFLAVWAALLAWTGVCGIFSRTITGEVEGFIAKAM